jgi:hypothetical protein
MPTSVRQLAELPSGLTTTAHYAAYGYHLARGVVDALGKAVAVASARTPGAKRPSAGRFSARFWACNQSRFRPPGRLAAQPPKVSRTLKHPAEGPRLRRGRASCGRDGTDNDHVPRWSVQPLSSSPHTLRKSRIAGGNAGRKGQCPSVPDRPFNGGQAATHIEKEPARGRLWLRSESARKCLGKAICPPPGFLPCVLSWTESDPPLGESNPRWAIPDKRPRVTDAQAPESRR